MRAHMLAHMIPSQEALTAYKAMERPLTNMCFDMSLQLITTSEALVAALILAHEWFAAGVKPASNY